MRWTGQLLFPAGDLLRSVLCRHCACPPGWSAGHGSPGGPLHVAFSHLSASLRATPGSLLFGASAQHVPTELSLNPFWGCGLCFQAPGRPWSCHCQDRRDHPLHRAEVQTRTVTGTQWAEPRTPSSQHFPLKPQPQ